MTKVHNNNRPWLRVAIKAYWAVLGVLVFSSVIQAIVYRPAAFAAPAQEALPFDTYFCNVIVGPSEAIIVGLSTLMMIGAGISYMLSLGQGGKEGIGGVSAAKSMIVAALSGMALYYMGTFLLGDCGFNVGGFIGGLFQ